MNQDSRHIRHYFVNIHLRYRRFLMFVVERGVFSSIIRLTCTLGKNFPPFSGITGEGGRGQSGRSKSYQNR